MNGSRTRDDGRVLALVGPATHLPLASAKKPLMSAIDIVEVIEGGFEGQKQGLEEGNWWNAMKAADYYTLRPDSVATQPNKR